MSHSQDDYEDYVPEDKNYGNDFHRSPGPVPMWVWIVLLSIILAPVIRSCNEKIGLHEIPAEDMRQ